MPDINILVVDDEKEIADLIEIYLVSDGYKVFKAENAEAGLNILDKQDIHLVLLDIMMPGMNGLEITRLSSTFLPFSLPRRYRVYRPSCSLIIFARPGAIGCTRQHLPFHPAFSFARSNQ